MAEDDPGELEVLELVKAIGQRQHEWMESEARGSRDLAGVGTRRELVGVLGGHSDLLRGAALSNASAFAFMCILAHCSVSWLLLISTNRRDIDGRPVGKARWRSRGWPSQQPVYGIAVWVRSDVPSPLTRP